MQQKNSPPSGPSFTLTDVYHILFRHKWKILSIWTLGIVAAIAIFATRSIPYRSRCELFIPYILENRTPNSVGSDTLVKPAEEGGQSILNTEVEILNSFDLALKVADIIGPEKILAKVGGGSDRFSAAVWVRNGLTVEAPRRSTVVRVAYQHPDESVVQPVLTQLIECYIKTHADIHQSTSIMDDLLKRKTELLQKDLSETEENLRLMKMQMGITDLKDAKKAFSDQLTDLTARLSAAEVELAEQQAVLTQMTNASPNAVPKIVEAGGTRPAQAPREKADAYRQICLNLANLWSQERRYIEQGYILTNEVVMLVRDNIRNAETLKQELEKEYPSLSGTRFETTSSTAPATPAGPDIAGQIARVSGIEARVEKQKLQIEAIRKRATELSNKESLITEFERKKEILENNYRSFSTKLEGSRIEDAVASSRIPNIKPIEMPTPAGKDPSRLYKKLGMLLAAAFGGGLALAFIIDLLLDQTLRRPSEIPGRLGVALFLSIPITNFKAPRLNGNGHKLLRAPAPEPDPNAGMAVAVSSPAENEQENPPWKPNHELRPFFETLRDRLMMNFEVRNLTHNPKLVAVTGCSKDAGVSTIASGLAACLSETGEGNVLLVNMNDDAEQGAAHYFRNGKLECGLDDALEAGKRDSALVKDNLYVVDETAQAETLPQVFNKRFSALLPRLRSSDYDYVIFDMPTVTQTSPTPRLARFMDMVFVVVEAEKNDRNMVKRATDLLQESKATVGVVMNKTKNYLPKILQHDI